eukprot:1854162-Prymnesium_polylepis.1
MASAPKEKEYTMDSVYSWAEKRQDAIERASRLRAERSAGLSPDSPPLRPQPPTQNNFMSPRGASPRSMITITAIGTPNSPAYRSIAPGSPGARPKSASAVHHMDLASARALQSELLRTGEAVSAAQAQVIEERARTSARVKQAEEQAAIAEERVRAKERKVTALDATRTRPWLAALASANAGLSPDFRLIPSARLFCSDGDGDGAGAGGGGGAAGADCRARARDAAARGPAAHAHAAAGRAAAADPHAERRAQAAHAR